MPKASTEIARSKQHARSRITNGSELLAGVDGRSAWARRMRDLIEAHTGDLGGVDACSQAERSLVRRIACLSVELELLESRFAGAGQASAADLDLYSRISGNLRRLLESVGLKRRQRDVTPRLSEYLEGKAQESTAS